MQITQLPSLDAVQLEFPDLAQPITVLPAAGDHRHPQPVSATSVAEPVASYVASTVHSSQVSFLAPDDAAFLFHLQRLLTEASRIYEGRAGTPLPDLPLITGPEDAYRFLAPEMEHLTQEQLRTLNLTTRHQVISAPLIYQGSVAASPIRLAEIFRPAVVASATALIVAHNHPSGDPEPSPQDKDLTRHLVQTGELFGIEVLDHIIIGHGRFVSLNERGYCI